jgi:hypothetical protein
MKTITRHINARYLANLTVEQIGDAVGLNPRYMGQLRSDVNRFAAAFPPPHSPYQESAD